MISSQTSRDKAFGAMFEDATGNRRVWTASRSSAEETSAVPAADPDAGIRL